MIKKTLTILALAGAILTVPVSANPFTGPRVEVSAGVDDVTKSVDRSDVTYSGAVGFDIGVTDNLTVGLEGNVDNLFNRRDLGVSARVGLVVSDDTLLYGGAGYSNYSDVFSRKLDGLSFKAGLEHNLSDNVYTGLSYRYTDFEGGVGKHGVAVSLGVRF